MSSRKPLLATALAVAAVTVTACGSPSAGGDTAAAPSGAGSSGATAAAQALGIDLSKCGTDPTVKLGDDVKVGQTYAQSGGPATAFAPVGAGVRVGFEAYAKTSTLPTKFTLVQADDQFAPDKALTATQKLIDQEKVGAMTATIGTPQVLAVRPLVNQLCVPLLSGSAGGATANAPQQFPWTVPFTLPSAVDARIWVADLAAKHPEGAKVAMFYANDNSGKEFLAAVKKYLAQTKNTLVAEQSIENTDAASPASQVTTLRNSAATVLMAAPTGAQCATLMKEVASQGWHPTFYMSSTCQGALFDVAGQAADGVYVNLYTKDPTRPPFNKDPDVLEAVSQIKELAPDATVNSSSVLGMLLASPFFKAAEQASASPLGLSRLGLLQAATHMSFQPPLAIDGVKYQLDYPKDQVAMEAASLRQYVASSKTFKEVKLYDFEGQMTGTASTP